MALSIAGGPVGETTVHHLIGPLLLRAGTRFGSRVIVCDPPADPIRLADPTGWLRPYTYSTGKGGVNNTVFPGLSR